MDLKKILKTIDDKLTQVIVKPNRYRWIFQSYSEDFVRQFPSNTIVFVNVGATNIIINDVWTLLPDASLELWGNQNELDMTIYKVSFNAAGGLLNVAVKEDSGIEGVLIPKYDYRQDLIKDKRKTDREKTLARERRVNVKGKMVLPNENKPTTGNYSKQRRHNNTDF